MDFKDILLQSIQWVLQNLLWELLALGVAVLVGIAKKMNWKWATPALYALGALALMLLIGLLARGIAMQSEVQITSANVEETMRKWVDRSLLSIKRDQSVPTDTRFRYIVVEPHGNSVAISSPKEPEGILLFQHTIVLAPDSLDIIRKLPVKKQSIVVEKLTAELARLGLEFFIVGDPGNPIRVINVQKARSFASLTEESFSTSVTGVVSAELLAKATVRLAITDAQDSQ